MLNINITSEENSHANIKSLAELTEIVDAGIKTFTDGEDITKDLNSVLKFSDKDYDPENFSGLGRKYLRKNIVYVDYPGLLRFDGFVEDVTTEQLIYRVPTFFYFDTVQKKFYGGELVNNNLVYYGLGILPGGIDPNPGYTAPDVNNGYAYNGKLYRYTTMDGLTEVEGQKKNVLTQQMINEPNTIYYIQYDYDLDGETIIVPENCVLIFSGGSVSNGTIELNNTKIVAHHKVFDDIQFKNAYATEMSAVWFGAVSDDILHISNNRWVVSDENMDLSIIVSKMIASNVYNIFIPAGIYYWTRTIYSHGDIRITGNFIKGDRYGTDVPSDVSTTPYMMNQVIAFDDRLNGNGLISIGYYDYDTDVVYRNSIYMSGLNFRGTYDPNIDVAILTGWLLYSEICNNTVLYTGYFVNSFSEDWRTKEWCNEHGEEYDPARHKPQSGLWKCCKIYNNDCVVWKSVFKCGLSDINIYYNYFTAHPSAANTNVTYFVDGYDWPSVGDCHIQNNYIDFFRVVYNASPSFRVISESNCYDCTTAVLDSLVRTDSGPQPKIPDSMSFINDNFIRINNYPSNVSNSSRKYLNYDPGDKEEIDDTGYYTKDTTFAIIKVFPKNLKMIIGGMSYVDYVYQDLDVVLPISIENITILGCSGSYFHFRKMALGNTRMLSVNIPSLDYNTVSTLPTGNLYTGQHVICNGKTYTYSGMRWTDGSGYIAAESKGPASDRPRILTNEDIGFQYFNTDSGRLEVYEGENVWKVIGDNSSSTSKKGDVSSGICLIPQNSIKTYKTYSIFTSITSEWSSTDYIRIWHGYADPGEHLGYEGHMALYKDRIAVEYFESGSQSPTLDNRYTLETPLTVGTLQVILNVETNSTQAVCTIINGSTRQNITIDFSKPCSGEIMAFGPQDLPVSTTTFAFDCSRYNAGTYVFGDSYISANPEDDTKWTSYLLSQGCDNFLLNGYPSQTAEDAFVDLLNIISHGHPKRIIWCMGLNDPDSSTAVNESWNTTLENLINLCLQENVELILATIPATSGNNNLSIQKYKNIIIRESGLRYIDFATAVGADENTGLWDEGMLSDDGVNPTAMGAEALYERAIAGVPNLLDTNNVSYDDLIDKPDVYTKVEIDHQLDDMNLTKADASVVADLSNALDNNYYDSSTVDSLLDSKADATSIPEKLSDLRDDVGYATTTLMENLLQTGYYDKTAIDTKVGDLQVAKADALVVANLSNTLANNYLDSTTINTLLGNKADSSNVYFKTQIDNITGFNKSIKIKNIDSVRISTGWKANVIANDSNIIWEHTNTPSQLLCYIIVNRSVQLGDAGLQLNPLINGEKVDPLKPINITFYKFYNGDLVLENGSPDKVEWGGDTMYKDLSQGAPGSYFTSNYLPWLNRDNYNLIGFVIENNDASDPAFTAGDSVSLTVKTNGVSKGDGYGYELSYDELLKYETSNYLKFSTSDDRNFKIGVRNDVTGETDFVITTEHSVYELPQVKYDILKESMSTGSKTLVVVPVTVDDSMLDTSARLNVTNIPND